MIYNLKTPLFLNPGHHQIRGAGHVGKLELHHNPNHHAPVAALGTVFSEIATGECQGVSILSVDKKNSVRRESFGTLGFTPFLMFFSLDLVQSPPNKRTLIPLPYPFGTKKSSLAIQGLPLHLIIPLYIPLYLQYHSW